MKYPETAIGRTFIELETEFLWQKIHCEIQSEISDKGRERDKKGMKKMQMTAITIVDMSCEGKEMKLGKITAFFESVILLSLLKF